MIPNTWLYQNKTRKYWIENPNVFVKRNWQRTLQINLDLLANFIVDIEEMADPNTGLYFDMTQLLLISSTPERNSSMNRKRPLIYRKGAWLITEDDLLNRHRGIKSKILKPSWIGLRGLLYTLGYVLEFDHGKPKNKSGIFILEGSFKRNHIRKATYGK